MTFIKSNQSCTEFGRCHFIMAYINALLLFGLLVFEMAAGSALEKGRFYPHR